MLIGCTLRISKAARPAALVVLMGALLSFLVVIPDIKAKTGTMEVPVKMADGQAKRIELYSGYYALVVGCGDYRRGWPPLPNPIKDAQEVAATLKGMGWEVVLVEDPDSESLQDALNRLMTGPGQDRDKGVLFWFSGHGETLEEADGTKLGYIVPVDAPDPRRDEGGFMRKAIDMRQLETVAKRIRSKHVLMVFDSCFSGAIFNMVRSSPSPYLQEKVALPVREFITAGREDERVPDRSVFKTCFLQGVRDKHADRNGDGYVTGEELGAYLQEEVVNYTRKAQHPQFGKINNPKLDKGDFVFVARQSAQESSSKAQPTTTDSDSLRQQLEVAKKDLEAEKLRQELEQTRWQLEQLKQVQKLPTEHVIAMPEVKSESSGNISAAVVPLSAPTEEKAQETGAVKPPEKPPPSAGVDKNTTGVPYTSPPPVATASTKTQADFGVDLRPQPTILEKDSRYRLAIFPFSLGRGRDFAYYTHTDRFFEDINKAIKETRIFFPAYSAYDLKNKIGTKIITNDLIAKEILNSVWSKSGSPELDVDLTVRLGRKLSVDAVLACKIRSEHHTPNAGASGSLLYPDSHLDKLETFLVDVNTRKKFSIDDTNLLSSLKKMFEEFQNSQSLAEAKAEQTNARQSTTQASAYSAQADTAREQTAFSFGTYSTASIEETSRTGNRLKLAILPFYMNGGRDFASYGNNDFLIASMVEVVKDTAMFSPLYSPYALGATFPTKTLPGVGAQDTASLWSARAGSPFPEPAVEQMAQIGAKLGVDTVLMCSFNITYSRGNHGNDILDALRVVLLDVKSRKKCIVDNRGDHTFWHGSMSKANEVFNTSMRAAFKDYKAENKQ